MLGAELPTLGAGLPTPAAELPKPAADADPEFAAHEERTAMLVRLSKTFHKEHIKCHVLGSINQQIGIRELCPELLIAGALGPPERDPIGQHKPEPTSPPEQFR